MKIDKENVEKFVEIRDSYSEVKGELDELESEIITISKKRDNLLSKLYNLREREARIINNIEEKTGEKVTTDTLLSLLKNI
tara:strand:+ start:769 stop:1011 length:243 start_codon:yes stop_codon:yes gene_type:complete